MDGLSTFILGNGGGGGGGGLPAGPTDGALARYSSASGAWVEVPLGVEGEVLTAVSGAPTWAPAIVESVAATQVSYPAAPGDVVVGDATTASFTVTLPRIDKTGGRAVRVKKVDVTAHTITVVVNLFDAGALIDGAASFVLDAQNMAIGLYTDGTNWWVF